ncbi:hypothetical protein ASE85_19435 [Sphingobium sp. Leaf26]|uniref:DUF4169 family protein n=1 Tax=Sphingobium sp. Leaf26 TaxID=1735693 RepID=UPI0006F39689|nr:DUF4169 family protein [Sphingobium sp. Leaf26]KQN06644.1 hypothetical protein ASE85_19435 [Sphingobium sp. Leaf26]
MTDIVNLRQVRKTKARTDKAKLAEENRARFGRTKAQRHADDMEKQRHMALLDGARRDRGEDK